MRARDYLNFEDSSHFQNLDRQTAVTRFAELETGSFILRPSSLGDAYIAATVKHIREGHAHDLHQYLFTYIENNWYRVRGQRLLAINSIVDYLRTMHADLIAPRAIQPIIPQHFSSSAMSAPVFVVPVISAPEGVHNPFSTEYILSMNQSASFFQPARNSQRAEEQDEPGAAPAANFSAHQL